MIDYYLEEDGGGNVIIYSKFGEEIARFFGKDAMEQAFRYAQNQRLRLRANVSPSDLMENHQLYRRRSRLLRFYNHSQPRISEDDANIKRIIIDENSYSDDNSFRSPDDFDENIELAPDEDDID